VDQRSSRNAVGVYDRPPAWRTRKVVVPVAIFVVVAIAYALYFLL
jgi:anti-sigma-K factor RskA